MMLEVLRQDYIRTARSKGLKDGVVIMRHAVKNALIPIVTLVGMQLPILVGGSVIMENIFNLPGLGGLSAVDVDDLAVDSAGDDRHFAAEHEFAGMPDCACY